MRKQKYSFIFFLQFKQYFMGGIWKAVLQAVILDKSTTFNISDSFFVYGWNIFEFKS